MQFRRSPGAPRSLCMPCPLFHCKGCAAWSACSSMAGKSCPWSSHTNACFSHTVSPDTGQAGGAMQGMIKQIHMCKPQHCLCIAAATWKLPDKVYKQVVGSHLALSGRV